MIENENFKINKKERRGFVITAACIVLGFIMPKMFTFFTLQKPYVPDGQTVAALAQLTVLDSQTNKSSVKDYNNNEFEKGNFRDFDHKQFVYDKSVKGELFNFDPNTLNEDGWKKLGLYDNTIKTIMNYRSKGGKFFQPDDIARIYGLSDNMVERLMPYVSIEKINYKKDIEYKNTVATVNSVENNTNITKDTKPNKNYAAFEIDINTADTTAWKNLPGIGSKLSARIVNYRTKLGGFYSVNQVAETFGLQDSVFQKIKTQLRISPNTFTTININTATVEQLNVHPYIDKSFANNIVQYRNQHGNYASENDIKKLALLKTEVWEKVKPYIVFY